MKHLRFGPILAAGYLCSVISTVAHPGHDLFDRGVTHTLTSPFHLIVLAAIGTGLFIAARLARAPRIQQVMRASGVAVILLSLLLWTFNH